LLMVLVVLSRRSKRRSIRVARAASVIGFWEDFLAIKC
jgi:hypothetical protein